MPHKQIDQKNMAAPGSPEWQHTVTASKIPAILGISPFQTPGELWMVMSGLTEAEHIEGDHLDFGHDVEDGLVNSWKRHNPGWQTNSGEVAYTDTDLPFPNQATLDRRAKRGRAFRIIECKASASRNIWGERGTELPGSVTAQVIGQMGISGIHRADVVALVGYDQPLAPRFYEVEWDPDLWDGIVDVVAEFHQSLGEAEPPVPPQDLIDALLAEKPETNAEGEEEWDEAEFDRLHQLEADLKAEKQRLIDKAQGLKRITVAGKSAMSLTPGRFAASRLPEEAKHLAKDPDVLKTTTRLDAKLFAQKYPSLAEIATGEPTFTFRL